MAATEAAEGFWSTTDVAEYLGVPDSTVRYWCYIGTGPRSFKIGRRRKFKPADVVKWAEAQADEPVEPAPQRRRSATKPAKKTSIRKRATTKKTARTKQ
jgi:excisionase family DNA binding protein